VGERGERDHDPRRREFFRNFGRQTVRSAGAVVAAADELRRAGGEAARELMDVGAVPSVAPPARVEHGTPRAAPETFRSPYRATDEGLVVLDQRELPGRVAMITVREPTEIASAIRLGVVNAGPVLGELVAYGLACAVAAAVGDGRDRDSIARTLDAGVATLREARHDVRAIPVALARVAGHFDELLASDDADGRALASGIRAEADRIASENASAHAALGRTAVERLASFGESVTLLVHGDCGPLSFGLVGPLTAALQSLAARETALHVFVTEGTPTREGARLVAPQLAQIDVPHTVVPDTAVAWLLAERPVDAAVIRADYVCANGDLASVVGSLNVAVLAERARVPLAAIAPPTAFDASMPDGSALAAELRWPAADGTPGPFGSRLDPGTDIVPSWLIGGLLTAGGAS
jgi:methylthioribose-1-phosphate isomerase